MIIIDTEKHDDAANMFNFASAVKESKEPFMFIENNIRIKVTDVLFETYDQQIEDRLNLRFKVTIKGIFILKVR
jgi:hypothetical protein